MSKSTADSRSIQIAEYAFNKIMSWAQATTEIVFLTAGRSDLITDAFRLKNIADKPSDYFEYCDKEEKELRKKIQSRGHDVIMGHSHPHKDHIRYPSKTDVRELPTDSLQMIVFPVERRLGIWHLKESYSETLKSQIQIRKIDKV